MRDIFSQQICTNWCSIIINSFELKKKTSIFGCSPYFNPLLQDAFLEWEESTEPGEQEGKGVALKSCTQFFQWLKTAELEDDEEEQKVKKKPVIFIFLNNYHSLGH